MLYRKAIFKMWLLFQTSRNSVMLLFSCFRIIFTLPFESRNLESTAPCTDCIFVYSAQKLHYSGAQECLRGHSFFVISLRQRWLMPHFYILHLARSPCPNCFLEPTKQLPDPPFLLLLFNTVWQLDLNSSENKLV